VNGVQIPFCILKPVSDFLLVSFSKSSFLCCQF